MQTPDSVLCGLRVRSWLPLPELPVWSGDDRPPDVVVTRGSGEYRATDSSLDITPAGEAVLTIHDVARFTVTGGRQVVVEPAPGVDEPAVRLFLLGSVLALLCYQRRLVPLHASCFATPAGAVAVTGTSGSGKSTLAASLSLRGTPILADDVCVIDPFTPDGPLVLPSVARMKLWRDTLDRMAIPVTGLERVRRGMDKFSFDHGALRTTPSRLAAIYHLSPGLNSQAAPVRLRGLPAVELLHGSVYRPSFAARMGCNEWVAGAVVSLLGAAPLVQVPAPAMAGRERVVDLLNV